MYSHLIETFIKVVETGSFSKAANDLYISSTAVIKQMNVFEDIVGVRLLERSHRGIKLTEAGKSIFHDCKYMIKYSNEAIDRAKSIDNNINNLIRVGTSITTPSQCILDLLPKIHEVNESINFQFVSFENTPENAIMILKHLGNNIDIVAGIYGKKFLQERQCLAYKIKDEPICIALSIYHPLANKEYLEIKDLYNQNLMIINKGYNEEIDKLRDDLLLNHPNIKLKDFSFYNLDIFNECQRNKDLLIAVNYWKNANPLLKIIPVKWDYTIPFGILYSLKPKENIIKFINILKTLKTS